MLRLLSIFSDVVLLEKLTAIGITDKQKLFIDLHGQPGASYVGAPLFLPAELVAEMERVPQVRGMLSRAKTIELITCYGADGLNGGPSVAQQLAGLLDKPVKAYKGEIVGWSGWDYFKHAKKRATVEPPIHHLRKPQVFATNSSRLSYTHHRFGHGS